MRGNSLYFLIALLDRLQRGLGEVFLRYRGNCETPRYHRRCAYWHKRGTVEPRRRGSASDSSSGFGSGHKMSAQALCVLTNHQCAYAISANHEPMTSVLANTMNLMLPQVARQLSYANILICACLRPPAGSMKCRCAIASHQDPVFNNEPWCARRVTAGPCDRRFHVDYPVHLQPFTTDMQSISRRTMTHIRPRDRKASSFVAVPSSHASRDRSFTRWIEPLWKVPPVINEIPFRARYVRYRPKPARVTKLDGPL